MTTRAGRYDPPVSLFERVKNLESSRRADRRQVKKIKKNPIKKSATRTDRIRRNKVANIRKSKKNIYETRHDRHSIVRVKIIMSKEEQRLNFATVYIKNRRKFI